MTTIFSVRQAAKEIGLTRARIYQLIEEGKIKARDVEGSFGNFQLVISAVEVAKAKRLRKELLEKKTPK